MRYRLGEVLSQLVQCGIFNLRDSTSSLKIENTELNMCLIYGVNVTKETEKTIKPWTLFGNN